MFHVEMGFLMGLVLQKGLLQMNNATTETQSAVTAAQAHAQSNPSTTATGTVSAPAPKCAETATSTTSPSTLSTHSSLATPKSVMKEQPTQTLDALLTVRSSPTFGNAIYQEEQLATSPAEMV